MSDNLSIPELCEDSYLPGYVALYREHDTVLRVGIIENHSTCDRISYKIEVLGVVCSPNFDVSPLVGKTISVFKSENDGTSNGYWNLEKEVLEN